MGHSHVRAQRFFPLYEVWGSPKKGGGCRSAAGVPQECRRSAAGVPQECRRSAAGVPQECRRSVRSKYISSHCIVSLIMRHQYADEIEKK